VGSRRRFHAARSTRLRAARLGPSATGGQATESLRSSRLRAIEYFARFEEDSFGYAAELRSGDAGEFVAQLHCRQVRGTGHGHGSGEAATVVARSHAPGVLARVAVDVHRHLGRLQTRDIGHDLRTNGDLALPGRSRSDDDVQATQQVDADRGTGHRAILRPRLGALFGREHGADVAHGRHRWLDDGGHADAVQPPGRTRPGLALLQSLAHCYGLRHFRQAALTRNVDNTAMRWPMQANRALTQKPTGEFPHLRPARHHHVHHTRDGRTPVASAQDATPRRLLSNRHRPRE